MQHPDPSRHPERRHESSFREAVRRLGDYEPGRSVQQVSQEFGIPIDEIVKLASNENPYGPSPEALAAIPTEFGNLHMYPWQEFADLRQCVAETNGVEPDNVVLGSGSESIVQMIPRLYVESGDEVIVSPQSYSRYAAGSALMNAVVRLVSLRDYHFDLDAVAGATNERTRIVWLCNPNNPTGTIIRRDEMLRFLDTIPETVAVVLDQAYGEFADDPQYAEGVRLVRDGYPNVIVLKTFSKAYALAGLRLGYAIADGAICQMLDRIAQPQSSQSVGLGERLQHDDVGIPVTHQPDTLGVLRVVGELPVGLIEHDRDRLGDGVQEPEHLVAPDDGTGRVVRVAQPDDPGSLVRGAGDGVEVEVVVPERHEPDHGVHQCRARRVA